MIKLETNLSTFMDIFIMCFFFLFKIFNLKVTDEITCQIVKYANVI